MRLPVPIVQQHLKAILDGILLWSGDSKNQFKLKVQPTSDCVLHTAGPEPSEFCAALHNRV